MSNITISHTGGNPVTVTTTTTAATDGAKHVEQITLSPDAAVKHLDIDENTTVEVVEAKPAV